MGESTFITGATGFIGGYAVRAIAKRFPEDRIELLVRDLETNPDKKDRLRRKFDYLGKRLVLTEGDVTQKIKSQTRPKRIVHLAGSTSFNEGKSKLIMDTNYGGTLNVIDFAEKYGVDDLVDTSSLYAALGYRGVVPEGLLSRANIPLDKLNTYQRSKLMAEDLVREFGGTILRPPMVVDPICSQYDGTITGYMHQIGNGIQAEFPGFFENLRNGSGPLDISLRLKGDPEAEKYFFPVDVFSTITAEIMARAHRGKTFNFVPKPIYGYEIAEALKNALKLKDVVYCPEINRPSRVEKQVNLRTHDYHRFTRSSDPVAESLNFHRVLEESGIHFRSMTGKDLEDLLVKYAKEKMVLPNGSH